MTSARPASDFQHVALRAGVQHFAHELLGLVCGEDEHALARPVREDLARGFEPVQLRHRHVEDHDVGPQALREIDGLAAILGLPDDAPAGDLLEGARDALANELVVVRDEYPYRFHSGGIRGSVARTSVPESPASTVNVPPTWRTRSRMPGEAHAQRERAP